MLCFESQYFPGKVKSRMEKQSWDPDARAGWKKKRFGSQMRFLEVNPDKDDVFCTVLMVLAFKAVRLFSSANRVAFLIDTCPRLLIPSVTCPRSAMYALSSHGLCLQRETQQKAN